MIKQYNQYIYKDGQWLLVGVSDQNNFITYVLQKDGDTITLKGDDNSTSDVVIKEFSDEAKAKLENIAAGAQVNVLEGVKVNGTKLTIDGEKLVDISVPTKLSQLTNDADYVTDANYVHTDNNYTTAEKNKLASIAASADVNTIEQIKVNNSALTPDGNKIVNITVPTKLTDLTNDNNFVTDANYVHTDNNYTTAEKNKLAGLSNYDDTEIKEQIAQAGKIDTIKVNGTAQPVVDKTVSLTIPTVPTNISAFTNDKKYQTEDEVTSLIADAVGEIQTLEYNVVSSLPATGETGVIYLVSNGGANPNIYDEYIYINGNFEKIGTTEIDLSGYLTKTEAGETYAKKVEVVQSDWNQNNESENDYIKNRPFYEGSEGEIVTLDKKFLPNEVVLEEEIFNSTETVLQDGNMEKFNDHGDGYYESFIFLFGTELKPGAIYDVTIGDKTYSDMTVGYVEQEGMFAYYISSYGDPMTNEMGENDFSLSSLYQGGAFVYSLLQWGEPRSTEQEVYIKLVEKQTQIKKELIPNDIINIGVIDLTYLTLNTMANALNTTSDAILSSLMGTTGNMFENVRVVVPQENNFGGVSTKTFKICPGEWDLAADMAVIVLVSEPYIKADGKVYVDTFKGYIPADPDDILYTNDNSYQSKLISDIQVDWDVPGEKSLASIKNKPFYEEKLDFGKNGSINTAETTDQEFMYFKMEGSFEDWASENIYLDFVSTTGVHYTTIPTSRDDEYIRFNDIPSDGENTSNTFNLILQKGTELDEGVIIAQFVVGTGTVSTIAWESLIVYTGVIKKIDKKFLPDEVVLQDELVQSDWNENDETAIDYVKNRTHYIISDYTTYPTLLIEEQNLEPAVLNGEKQPTAVPTSNSIPSSSYAELFEKYSHLLESGTNNSNFLPIVIRLSIGDVVIDYEGSINSSFSSSFGTTYSASVGEQITNINITEEYPYIESISFLFGPAPMINFTSVEEVEQYPTITIKEELLIPERATKTIDKDFLPYYQGFNYGEAFNDLANQATGKNSHAEGTNTYAGGDSSHAEGGGIGFKATFTIADTGYLSEEGELWDALEIGERNFMLPIEKGVNRWCVGDRIKLVNQFTRDIIDFEEPLVIEEVSSHTSWEEKEYSYVICSRQFTEKDLELLNSDLLYVLGITSVNYISDTSEAAHLEGKNTKIIGASSFYNAEGSHVEGIGTIATREGQHVQGQYNIPDSSVNTSDYYLHIIGNGDSDAERSNAHTVDSKGNAWYSGKVTAGSDPVDAMDLVTKQYLENNSWIYIKGKIVSNDELASSPSVINDASSDTTILNKALATPGAMVFNIDNEYYNLRFTFEKEEGVME